MVDVFDCILFILFCDDNFFLKLKRLHRAVGGLEYIIADLTQRRHLTHKKSPTFLKLNHNWIQGFNKLLTIARVQLVNCVNCVVSWY